MNKKRIVFFTASAWGHMLSTLPVIKGLMKSEGEKIEIDCFSYATFEPLIKSTGANFISYVGEENNQKMDPSNLVDFLAVLATIHQSAYKYYLNVMKESKPDLIIYDSITSFAKDIAKQLNIKSVCLVTHNPSTQKESVYNGAVLEFMKHKKQLDQIQESYDKFRKANGLPKAKVTDIFLNTGDLTLIFSPKEWVKFPESYDSSVHFVGTTIKERRKEQTEQYENYDIYVALGTIIEGADLLNQIASSEVIKNSKTIMSVGGSNIKGSPNITLVKKTQQIALLENCNMFINHGGLNSVFESIYCGVPQIIIPRTRETKTIGKKVARMKAGISLKEFDEKEVKKFIKNLDTYKANVKKCQEIFRKYDATQTSVRLIKELLEK